ncbi:MAG: aliphatic sulfonate ABC transporter permease SsuC [Bacillaceae bacterium]|jgi:ABC-type nitrate/sulfonate/bicarbonate transport system, permease component|uniref:Aliphatic sulfonate ABC transporter permease SsuC n=1 Tax=Aeribacillus composti TaxID=1868734 RepID=A0ABY9WD25_9BACI|nr:MULTISPECIES: aliphatic sulfonate ABC transporter permease SsuC [Aeribacillus]AXI39346.1 aliphatic sulfonate ABC transporter permease SsuC [Bacillaceae bacterium ZC4]REJ21084.1 MAG: aliphatic sulfonate ABC transporter permease SsuC [Bacillaceae bacterium]KZM54113.1 alkanesulfonate transporter permease subunit [Aeribacillus pallidus]MDR9792590.1 aliphatic sulfonate ABC transporter permease SsuC [Aeribacillus pallidus]MDR9796483.1 aliphatic sulfonate ABC transporter permease SsuC [Aeribacillu
MKKSLFSDQVKKQLIPWLLPILILIIWQLLSSKGILSTKILPVPSDVVMAGVELIRSGELFQHLLISFKRAIIGFLIGGSIGLFLGLINGLFPIADRIFDTTIQMVRNIPHLAMIPLVILWFGIGEEAKVFLVAAGVLFPIYVNTLHGIRSVDQGLIEMGRVYGLRSWLLFWQVVLPGALPSILVGVRYALGIMWLTLIVAETISADSGIGYMAMNAREFMQTDVVLLSILLYALFGKIADSMAKWLERKCLNWNPNYQNL